MGRKYAPQIYAEQLEESSRGYPLWFPEEEEQDGGLRNDVRAGDVGYIDSDGRFVRFFNVREGVHNDPNLYKMKDPASLEKFKPLTLDSRLWDWKENYINPGQIASHTVKANSIDASAQAELAPGSPGLAFEVSCESDEGAALFTSKGASREAVRPNVAWGSYVRKHHASWYHFVRDELGLEISAEDIILVTGTVKSEDWMMVAYGSNGKTIGGGIEGGVPAIANVGLKFQHTSKHSSAPVYRRGPPHRVNPSSSTNLITGPPGDSPPRHHKPTFDQCLFISRYKIKGRIFGMPLRIKGGAEEDEEEGDDDMNVDVQPVLTPLDALLNHMLERQQDADFVVVDDGSLSEALEAYGRQNVTDPAEIRDFFDAHPELIETEGKIASISEEELVRKSFFARVNAAQAAAGPVTQQTRRSRPNIKDGTLVVPRSYGADKKIKWPHFTMRDKDQEGGSVTALALSPDNRTLATGADDSAVRIWDIITGKRLHHWTRHDDTVWSVAYSPDGKKLVSGSADCKALVWNLESEEENMEPEGELVGHEMDVWAVAFSPDGNLIATGSVDATVRIWDAATKNVIHIMDGHEVNVTAVVFSPDGTRLASYADSSAILWDPMTGEKIADLEGHDGVIWSLSFSRDGKRIVTSSEDVTSRIWDAVTGEELVTLHEHTGPIWTAVFSPDGRRVATGSYDSTIVIVDSFTGKLIHQFTERPAIVNTVAWSSDGIYLVSGSADGYVKLWNAMSGIFVAEFQGHQDKVKTVDFTLDDRIVISSSEDGTVRTFDIADTFRLCEVF